MYKGIQKALRREYLIRQRDIGSEMEMKAESHWIEAKHSFVYLSPFHYL